MMDALSLENIRYCYPNNGYFTLDIAKLSFKQGDITAICGGNGSGKTTLGKLAVGILRPTQGSILLFGEDISQWPLGKIGGRVGYVFQEPARQIFALTVIEQMTFPLILNGMERQSATQIARSLLAQFELDGLENANTFPLSRGEKQRLAIASALVGGASFLVMDEPTTGLDNRRKQTLGSMLLQLAQQKIGSVIISHDSDFVQKYATASYTLQEGGLLG